LLSTGPKSVEGKQASRINATTHGMTAENPEVAAAITDRFEARRAAWAKEYRPTGDTGDWALDRLVTASFQIEQCEQSFQAAAIEQQTRASLSWDLDARADAAVLYSKLHHQPMVVAARLETSLHGCDALLVAWEGLAAATEANGTLDEAQVTLALDLLGVDPALRTGRTILDGRIEAEIETHRRDFIDDEISRLRALRESAFVPLDDLNRRIAASGAAVFESKPARLILRYERDAWRRYREAIRVLHHPESESQPAPASAVETKPIPVAPPPSKPAKPLVPDRSNDPIHDDYVPFTLADAVRQAIAKDELTRLPSDQPLTYEEIYAGALKLNQLDRS